MYLRIMIEMNNDAFGQDGYTAACEVSRILRDYCQHLQAASEFDRGFRDINGNRVGGATFIDGDSALFKADSTIGRTLGELT